MLEIEVIPLTPFQQNCSLVWCDKILQGALVDPGGDIERILERIVLSGVWVAQILLTHGHVDHASAGSEFA